MRLKLVPSNTNWDFFRWSFVTFGFSTFLVIASIVAFLTVGLNFGIDFRGGTTIRTESASAVDVASYRAALNALDLADVSVTEVFDPSFGPDKHVAQVRFQVAGATEAVPPELIAKVEEALRAVDPSITFPSVESVGPKVSGELVLMAVLAVGLALVAIAIYVWLRFEWQFAIGALISLFHDVALTLGVFVLFQIKFDISIIAALLTIIGYSINDTVVVFDRHRENLIKFKTKPLKDLLNLSINETMARTLMTASTTLISLIVLLVLGGDVIRGFVFAMTFGVVIGTYSSIYVASNYVLYLGVKRDWGKTADTAVPTGTRFGKAEGPAPK